MYAHTVCQEDSNANDMGRQMPRVATVVLTYKTGNPRLLYFKTNCKITVSEMVLLGKGGENINIYILGVPPFRPIPSGTADVGTGLSHHLNLKY